MREIPLTQGKVALVDDADYEWLSQWKWFAYKKRGIWYAGRSDYDPSTQSCYQVPMHRAILGLSRNDGRTGDHADRNGLNNWRSNLRQANRRQQAQNRGRRSDNSSGFKGVTWHSAMGAWTARITIDGVLTVIGYYETKELAYSAYQGAALQHFGQFAAI